MMVSGLLLSIQLLCACVQHLQMQQYVLQATAASALQVEAWQYYRTIRSASTTQ
jgi:hypothetical protein